MGAIHGAQRRALPVAEINALEVKVDQTRVALSLSVGIASCEERETLFFDTLMSQAEMAMEWASKEGGGRVVVFDKDRFLGPA